MDEKKATLKEHYDYLIIGADAAGNSAVGQIRRNDKEGSIGVLEKGGIIAYGACGLPYAVSGQIQSFDKLVHFTATGFGAKNNADILIHHEAVEVDFDKKEVTVRLLQENSEKKVTYNKLLIGTGAQPIRLPFIDYSSERVFELKTVPDGQAIQNFCKNNTVKKAAIIGSGYIGMEAAENFREMGIEVDIYEALDRPVPKMSKFISSGIAPLIGKHDINFFSESKVTAVKTDDSKVILETGDGSRDYDILLSAIGVRPATEFLREGSIDMEKGAIVVNERCETSVKDVWAGGDCALVNHRILKKNTYLPLGHTANKQGRIAGINMSGGDISLPGIVGTVIFRFFDTAFAHTGLTLDEAKEAGYNAATAMAQRPSKAGYMPGAGKAKVEIIYDQANGTILGASLVGPLDSFGMIDSAAVMVYTGMSIEEATWFDFAYAPPFAPVWNALISAAGKASSGAD